MEKSTFFIPTMVINSHCSFIVHNHKQHQRLLSHVGEQEWIAKNFLLSPVTTYAKTTSFILNKTGHIFIKNESNNLEKQIFFEFNLGLKSGHWQ